MTYVYYRGAGPCRVLDPCADPQVILIQQVYGLGGAVTIRLPRDQFSVRTRPLMKKEEVPSIWQILADPPLPPPKGAWTKRYRLYMEKIAEGIPDELASLYRDLMGQDEPTFAERRVADRVLSGLAAELSIVMGEDRAAIEQRIKKMFERVERDLSPLTLREIPLDQTTRLAFIVPLSVPVSWGEGAYHGWKEDLRLGGTGPDREALRADLEHTFKTLWEEYVRCPASELARSGLALRRVLKKYGKEFPVKK